MSSIPERRIPSGAGKRTPLRGCLLFTLLGMLAAFVVGILLVNFILLPWHVRLGREATVPSVVGLDRDEAEAQLKAAGFTTGDARYVSDTLYPTGKVVDTRPRPGSRVKVGRVVGLDISAGQEKTVVPQVYNLPVRRAQAAVENAGLHVGTIETVSSNSVPEGQVIAADPSAGSKLNKGSAVNLTVSMGSAGGFEMPRLTGLPLDRAQDVVLNSGLMLAETTARVSPEPNGTVLNQDPAEHAEVQSGDQVRLVIARPAGAAPASRSAKTPAKTTKTATGREVKPAAKPKKMTSTTNKPAVKTK